MMMILKVLPSFPYRYLLGRVISQTDIFLLIDFGEPLTAKEQQEKERLLEEVREDKSPIVVQKL